MAEPKRLWTYTLDSWCIDVRVAWTLEYKTTPPYKKKVLCRSIYRSIFILFNRLIKFPLDDKKEREPCSPPSKQQSSFPSYRQFLMNGGIHFLHPYG